MALDPYYPDIYLHLQAQVLFQLGRYSEAAALLKRRILRNPDTDASRVLLAATYGQMGLFERRARRGGSAARQSGLFARTSPEGAAV